MPSIIVMLAPKWRLRIFSQTHPAAFCSVCQRSFGSERVRGRSLKAANIILLCSSTLRGSPNGRSTAKTRGGSTRFVIQQHAFHCLHDVGLTATGVIICSRQSSVGRNSFAKICSPRQEGNRRGAGCESPVRGRALRKDSWPGRSVSLAAKPSRPACPASRVLAFE